MTECLGRRESMSEVEEAHVAIYFESGERVEVGKGGETGEVGEGSEGVECFEGCESCEGELVAVVEVMSKVVFCLKRMVGRDNKPAVTATPNPMLSAIIVRKTYIFGIGV